MGAVVLKFADVGSIALRIFIGMLAQLPRADTHSTVRITMAITNLAMCDGRQGDSKLTIEGNGVHQNEAEAEIETD
jgi:hypothetical protein